VFSSLPPVTRGKHNKTYTLQQVTGGKEENTIRHLQQTTGGKEENTIRHIPSNK
jgi:hypothetical protein